MNKAANAAASAERPPIRSWLFVPGNKPTWMDKAVAAGADALILDLEDSVPSGDKVAARDIVAAKIDDLAAQRQRVYVRVNRSPYLYDFDDILAVVGPGLEGILISKPCGPEDLHVVDMMLSEAELTKGRPIGSTAVAVGLETARSMQLAFEIAEHPRVTVLVGVSAKNADTARALAIEWSAEGRESLFLKSRVVMAARAAGVQPVGGLWQEVHDLDGLRNYSAADRALGMSGEVLLHPSNVPVVNELFSPSAEDVAYYQGLLDAVAAAEAEGRASVVYDGEHVDLAHAETARQIVALAKAYDQQ